MKTAAVALAAGSAATALAAPIDQRLDEAIDTALRERRIVGAVVLVLCDGQPVYRRAAGFADREQNKPMREDAIFLLSSVTKPIVTAAALRMAEQGVLQLDAPVTRWLPDFAPRLADGTQPVITVAQLLSHTAGLSYRFWEPDGSAYGVLDVSDGLDQPGLPLETNLRRIAAAPLAYPPGAGWRYSLATDVLGALLERAAGKPLPRVVRELVTGPLGMDDTAFVVRDARRLVTHYVNDADGPRRMRERDTVAFNASVIRFAPARLAHPQSYPSGGAGMAGTAPDVLRLLAALASGDGLLRRATVDTMMRAHAGAWAQTQGPGWGFGYGGAVLVDPKAAGTSMPAGTFQWGGVYGHNWLVDPVNRIVLVALTNTSVEGMAGQFPADLRDAIYGAETEIRAGKTRATTCGGQRTSNAAR